MVKHNVAAPQEVTKEASVEIQDLVCYWEKVKNDQLVLNEYIVLPWSVTNALPVTYRVWMFQHCRTFPSA